MTIVNKNESDDDDDESDSDCQIKTSCFKIQFECKKDENDKTTSRSADIDNVHTCYQNAFYKCVKDLVPGAITDARVREIRALDWCSFRDADYSGQ
jgi:hypothetical protein